MSDGNIKLDFFTNSDYLSTTEFIAKLVEEVEEVKECINIIVDSSMVSLCNVSEEFDAIHPDVVDDYILEILDVMQVCYTYLSNFPTDAIRTLNVKHLDKLEKRYA